MKVVDLDQATHGFTFKSNGKVHVVVSKSRCLDFVSVLKILIKIGLGSFGQYL